MKELQRILKSIHTTQKDPKKFILKKDIEDLVEWLDKHPSVLEPSAVHDAVMDDCGEGVILDEDDVHQLITSQFGMDISSLGEEFSELYDISYCSQVQILVVKTPT